MGRRRRPPWQLRQAGIQTREMELEFRRQLSVKDHKWWWLTYRCAVCDHLRAQVHSTVRLPYRVWLAWVTVLMGVLWVKALVSVLRGCPQCRFEEETGRWRWGDDVGDV